MLAAMCGRDWRKTKAEAEKSVETRWLRQVKGATLLGGIERR